MLRRPPRSTLFPYTNALPIFTAAVASFDRSRWDLKPSTKTSYFKTFNRFGRFIENEIGRPAQLGDLVDDNVNAFLAQEADRTEEHTSELQSQSNLVCRLLLEK